MALNAQQISKLGNRLWRDPELALYALLDGAGIPDLLDRLYGEAGPAFACLYDGELEPDIAEVAPYIAHVEPSSAFANWLLAGWGERRGIFALVPAALELPVLRRHFRKLNMVYGPDCAPLLFRYYDPRVLRLFLPTCDAAQLKAMFGPVARFVAETDSANDGVLIAAAGGDLVLEAFSLA